MGYAQDKGREYERRFAERYGARPTPGSGATARYKLDVDQVSVLWSLKYTGASSYRLAADDLQEAFAGAQGPGSRSVMPAMAINIDGLGEEVAVLRVRDLMALLRGEVLVDVSPERRDIKLARADPLRALQDDAL